MTDPPQRPGDDGRPLDSSTESLNAYFARQPELHRTGPVIEPTEFFVRSHNPVRPAPARRPRPRIGVLPVVIVLLLACCGYGGVRALRDDDEPERTGLPAATPTATYSYVPPTFSSPTPPPVPTRSPPPPSPTKPSLDDVKVRDCLRNDGTDNDPEMVPAACVSGTYQVLERLYATIDPSRCQNVRGYNAHYTVTYYLNGVPSIAQSYVFCLKKL